MRRAFRFAPVVFLALLVAGIAFAAAYSGTFAAIWNTPVYAKAGAFIGTGAPDSTTNRLTKVRGGTVVYDFPALGEPKSALMVPCRDSISTATLTGVAFGDVCMAASPIALPADATLQCYVSAANTVKVRACNSGLTDAGTIDLDDAGYSVTVFSRQ